MMMELLAPAGDFEGMEGAIGAGADAVYAGGAMFGARAYAKNFTREELLEAIDYVHLRGKKLYLTVNTLLKSREIQKDLYDYLAPFYERGLDAVIVQDLGVMAQIRRQFPKLAIHASTQMTVTGPEGMRFLEKYGVKRVVAARELSLVELEEMRKASPLEIEVFVHGALCYCYSGQCLFSSILGGRSGNRGRCAQPCRLPYEYVEGSGQKLPLLSPKDMCAIELLPEIARAGVTSLKIEGRMKQPGYTAGVVNFYRKYLDLLERDGEEAYRVDQKDKEALLELFSRGGSHPGYFKQHNGPSMMAFDSDKKIGNRYPEIIKNKEKVKGILILFAGSPAILELSYAGKTVRLEEGMVQEAKNQPMTDERVRRQMEKMNETPYVFESLEIQMGDSIFVPVKALNELRRNAVAALTDELLASGRREGVPKLSDEKEEKKDIEHNKDAAFVCASCETEDQMSACLEADGIRRLYVPMDLMETCLEDDKAKDREIFAAMPHVVRFGDLAPYEERIRQWLSKGLAGFLVRNLETYGWLQARGWGEKCLLDASLYTWNDKAQTFWRGEGVLGDTVPLELNRKELAHRDNHDSEMLIYGYLPLMVSAQCVRKNTEGCRKKTGVVHIRDRYQKQFPVKHYCDFCYNVIYNSLPYGLPDEREEVLALGVRSLRLSFTLESGRETRRVLREFCHTHTVTKESAYTKGHWNRGAR